MENICDRNVVIETVLYAQSLESPCFIIIENNRRLGSVLNKALSMDNDWYLVENVNVLGSTLVK